MYIETRDFYLLPVYRLELHHQINFMFLKVLFIKIGRQPRVNSTFYRLVVIR